MRSALVGLVVVVMACKSGDKPAAKEELGAPAPAAAPTAPAAAAKPLDLVRVTDARAVATLAGKPPVLVVIDGENKTYLAAADSLDELATRDLMAGAKPASVRRIESFVFETSALGIAPVRAVRDYEPLPPELEDLEDLEDLDSNALAADDPPPPEEEDYPDPGTDDSAAKPVEAPRAEGSYRMKKIPADPALAPRPGPPAPSVPPTDRLGLIRGKIVDQLADQRALIFASPRASSRALLELVHNTRGAIAVVHENTVHPLRLQFFFKGERRDRAFASVNGTELYLTKDGDLAKLTAGLDPEQPIDLFIPEGVDAQRLIDALVALELAGAQVIGIAPAWDAPKPRPRRAR